jgi:ribonuclease-3
MDPLEASLGFGVRDQALYRQALTHKSAARNQRSNERLEFLGDSVLSLVVTRYLFDRYPDASEGLLTRLRTKIVSGTMLCKLSEQLGLHNLVRMNARAQNAGWKNNPRIKEDLFEALIGAIYLDQGLPRCRQFITGMIERHVDWESIHEDTNWKDQLMRATQLMGWELPDYSVVGTCGPDHSKQFTVRVRVKGEEVGMGTSRSKKLAEQEAAKKAMSLLNIDLPATNSSYLSHRGHGEATAHTRG